MDTKYLLMLPINWMNITKFRAFMWRLQKNYNAYCTPKSFFVEKYFYSWDPNIHGPRNYLLSFYVANIIDQCSTTKHYTPAVFRNVISKRRDHGI